jgi:trigger factor
VIIDFVGTVDGEPFSGGEGRDQLIDLGAGQLIPGFEDGLIGASAGDELTIDATFPEDYAASHVKGKDAQFQITVKEVKHRDLPDLDDEFASDAAGYDTLEELRESIASELLEHDKGLVESEFRAGALDAIVEGATVDVPDKLVEARAKELLDRMLHTLGHQGITKEHYLKISGKAEEELIEESKPDAEQALRREAVLAAVIKAEAIEPTEQQLLDALEGAAEREQLSREKLLAKLRQAGRVEHLAAEVAAEMALDLVVTEAKPVSPNEAGEKKAKAEPKKKPAAKKKAAAKKGKKGDDLWTPDADAPEGDKGKLWTPGS